MMKALQYLAVGFAADTLLKKAPPAYFVAGILFVVWNTTREVSE